MAARNCKDIFNAVYNNVKRVYISTLYSSKVKSRTLSETLSEDESLKMNATSDPVSETNTNSKEIEGATTETVKESVERMAEEDVVAEIRLELEEKFPFALASVCSNLAHIDRKYRELKGFDEQEDFSECYIDLGDTFPLCERFIFSCIMFVCSMVLIDVEEKSSDDFYEKYATSVMQILSEIPGTNKSIVEKYPY